MKCFKCGWAVPYDASFLEQACISCDGTFKYTAEEYLEHPELGLVTESRSAQLALAQTISQGLSQEEPVIAEAGTGVGKSFAYLVPALLSGKRVVVTTAKKTLQTQLIEKDLPYLQKKLGIPTGQHPLFARAYGKANYPCIKRVNEKTNNTVFKGQVAQDFFERSKYGVWEDAPQAIPGVAKKQLTVISKGFKHLSADSCEGSSCSRYGDCQYVEARTQVANAKIVVANHWLVGFDMLLSQTEDLHFLGEYTTLIVDEAHKLEDGIRGAFTTEIKRSALREGTYHIEKVVGHLSDADSLGGRVDGKLPYQAPLEAAWDALFKRVKGTSLMGLGREGDTLQNCIGQTMQGLNDKYVRRTFTFRGNANNYVFGLAKLLNENLPEEAVVTSNMVAAAYKALTDGSRALFHAHVNIVKKLTETTAALELLKQKDPNNAVYVEDNGQYSAIKIAPIDVHQFMRIHRKSVPTHVYTSATLAINGSLRHFGYRMGVDMNTVLQALHGSAFNFDKQALLYVSPNTEIASGGVNPSPGYINKLANEIFTLIQASNGNAFVLFTSTNEMRAVAEALDDMGCALPIIMQEGAASETLRDFNNTPNSVLLGLKSFWEGVDIPGSKLELVIIAKLPFPMRSDPIIQAKCDKAGDKWFPEVYIPEMILDLRQGVGRLIRSKKDRGVVALLDARLTKKSYKTMVLRSLGFNNITNNQRAATKALQNLAAQRT